MTKPMSMRSEFWIMKKCDYGWEHWETCKSKHDAKEKLRKGFRGEPGDKKTFRIVKIEYHFIEETK